METHVDSLRSIFGFPVFCILILVSTQIQADDMPTLDLVEVTARSDDLIGTASSASEGTVTKKELVTRPILILVGYLRAFLG